MMADSPRGVRPADQLLTFSTMLLFRRVDPGEPLGRERAHGRVLAHVHRRTHRALAVEEKREGERQVPRAGT